MESRKRLGDLLIASGKIKPEVLEHALRVQVSGNRRLGAILVKMGSITEEELVNFLLEQQGLQPARINIETEFDPQVKKLLPRYLCRKYGLIPLTLGKGENVLQVAMVDPFDDVAISDVGNYTGKVVMGMPASAKEIEQAIARYIPISCKDIFNPQIFNHLTKAASLIALVLAFAAVWLVYSAVVREKYGVVSRLEHETIYRNHDLIVSFEKEGKISLLGHGAYAEGYYAVLFNDRDSLLSFLEKKKDTFSQKQMNWLHWVLQQVPLKTG